ncbi:MULTISPECIES: GNAT family N-acetyltransferase [unclassified Arthrobacter]|uniref:GNAT family N-acetyltransferase n=1 Tax=unclassified Arthrobacter TaxID=235627 RepID=UPI002104F44E|nr:MULTISPECIES: GNAT family N-acetyltransferase [unclassified Arthrobacter]MCQ1987586.1 GNAT family N-acetyltransferase [Arthrobacter sp. zg-Y844]MCQ1996453.1 GNAT family N-acetyltransferase [Arthrobacter sp. zg-Y1171]UWX82510.1 GNAT family N-acetyltransferase [Arthrobacter sp. zg-Y1171]
MRTLETDRLTLRPFTSEDAAFVLDLYSRMEVQRFLGTNPKLMQDRAEALALIEAWAGRDDGTCGVWAVQDKDTGQLAGTLLLKPIPASGPERKPSDDIEIGWHFHPDSWGKGYASEAGAAVLAHAFAAGLPQVVAVTNPANTASMRVCGKIGLQHQGSTDRYYNTVCELFTAENPG